MLIVINLYSELIILMYLNTSHVNVNPLLVSIVLARIINLNTSHVNVNQRLQLEAFINNIHLNTSHVNVNPTVKDRRNGC